MVLIIDIIAAQSKRRQPIRDLTEWVAAFWLDNRLKLNVHRRHGSVYGYTRKHDFRWVNKEGTILTKDTVNKHNRLLHDCADRTDRFKLYKSGKLWLVAGMASLTFGLGALTVKGNAVHADTAEPEVQSQSATSTNKVVLASSQKSTADDQADTSAATQTAEAAAQPETSTDTAATADDTSATQSTEPAASASQTDATQQTATPDATQAETQDNSDSTPTEVTNLGAATPEEVEQAKQTAGARYEQTGNAQVVTASQGTADDGDTPVTGTADNGDTPITGNAATVGRTGVQHADGSQEYRTDDLTALFTKTAYSVISAANGTSTGDNAALYSSHTLRPKK